LSAVGILSDVTGNSMTHTCPADTVAGLAGANVNRPGDDSVIVKLAPTQPWDPVAVAASPKTPGSAVHTPAVEAQAGTTVIEVTVMGCVASRPVEVLRIEMVPVKVSPTVTAVGKSGVTPTPTPACAGAVGARNPSRTTTENSTALGTDRLTGMAICPRPATTW